MRRLTPAVSGSTSSRRQAATTSDFPFSSSGGTASTTTASRTSRSVASPTRISPPPAAASSRCATTTASPVANACPCAGSPAIHLPGVDAGAHRDPDAVVALELVVQPDELVAQLDRRTDRAQRVVLVHERNPERGHHGVADELLDRAAVAIEHVTSSLVIARPDAAQRLGVELLAERGRVGPRRRRRA